MGLDLEGFAIDFTGVQIPYPPVSINLERVGRIWDVNRIQPTDFLDILGHDQAPVPEQKPRKYRGLCYL